jgi:hypothetical protein
LFECIPPSGKIVGNPCSWGNTAKPKMSIDPNQKFGSEMPTKDSEVTMLSSLLYCRTALMIPIGTAMSRVTM